MQSYVPRTTIHVATAVFDPSRNDGLMGHTNERPQGAHVLIGDSIPHGANILSVWYKAGVTPTSGGDATIGLTLSGWTGAVITAAALSTTVWNQAQNIAAAPPAATLTTPLVGSSHMVATVAAFNLTAGQIYFMILYSLTK